MKPQTACNLCLMEEYTPVIPRVVRAWAYVIGLAAGAAGPVLAAFGLAEGWIALASAVAGVASAIALGYSRQWLGGSDPEQRAERRAYADEQAALAEEDIL